MKKKLLMLRGLIASGKTTFAKQLVLEQENWCRVNKDDLREMVHAGKWSKDNEKLIVEARDTLVNKFLSTGKSVIVDDTGFNPDHEYQLRGIARYHGAEFEIKEFDTPLEVCIERDSKRGKPVGKDIIIKMYNQYLKPKAIEYTEDCLRQNAVCCDLDGTLAQMYDRSPFDWRRVGEDVVVDHVKEILQKFQTDHKILIVSGRDEICRPETEQWLKDNDIHWDQLFMRPMNNKEKDYVVKERIYKEYIWPRYQVKFVIDDRPQVIRKWRELGLNVLNVGDGVEF